MVGVDEDAGPREVGVDRDVGARRVVVDENDGPPRVTIDEHGSPLRHTIDGIGIGEHAPRGTPPPKPGPEEPAGPPENDTGPAEPAREWITSQPSLKVRHLRNPARRRAKRTSPLSGGMIIMLAAMSVACAGADRPREEGETPLPTLPSTHRPTAAASATTREPRGKLPRTAVPPLGRD